LTNFKCYLANIDDVTPEKYNKTAIFFIYLYSSM